MLLPSRKACYFTLLVLMLMVSYQALKTYTYTNIIADEYKLSATQSILNEVIENVKEDTSALKYILQWTSPRSVPLVYMGQGQKTFLEKQCPYTNCFVTANRSFLGDYSKFDVIVFNGPEAIRLSSLPTRRSPHQKYVFATIESSDNYPVCSNRFDGYFNWTWTYNLESEVQWGYVAIRDSKGVKVGPKKQMHWMKFKDMYPVSEEFKNELKTKTKAAAWFVSNCHTRSKREDFVKELKSEMKNYSLVLDVYGKCGDLKCPNKDVKDCDKLLKENYYYYLSFENFFSEDYVTEKLLHPLVNNVVPIVYGGANYTRFMPDGIYLNAKEFDVKTLVSKMNEGIKDAEKYAEYFRWKKHYSYHRLIKTLETDPYCLFCAQLNNEEMVKKTTIYKEFRSWWDPPGRC
ncbi:alpha-(1,3)-fucosyltransferase C-like [Trichoplusia ni]|uniref:Fucosyltransferase n=1 Tax=Trichoplusia ni TaxID=7111 RepID=A0A7E5VN64_TRINI|nr:alpha-(1,3)-fucosyltransferase C-like [Trichoplusia ni]